MTEFLPNTDNFFKYLLTIGLLLIVFTILYPIQKQKEVDLEILSYNTEAGILNFKINSLTKEVNDLQEETNSVQHSLDSLKTLRDHSNIEEAKRIEGLRVSIKQDFDKTKSRLTILADSLTVNQITAEQQKRRIQKLESYFAFFRNYKLILLILGFVLSFIGMRYWLASVYMEEVKKGKEVETAYQSSFVRHIEFCKRRFVNKWTVVFCILLLVALLLAICWTDF